MEAMKLDRPPRRVAFLIAGLAMFGPFSIDAIFPGFPAIAAEFGASSVMMQQIISVYLGGFALMSLFHGPLSDALGRRKVVLWSTFVFVLASAGAALSPSLKVLLVWRLIQGCSDCGRLPLRLWWMAHRLLGGLSFCRRNPAALGIDLSGVVAY